MNEWTHVEPTIETPSAVEEAYTSPFPKDTISGGVALVRALIEEGVDTLFGYPGGAIMPVYDVLYDYQEQLKHYLARHEQGLIHAAQGYARMKRQAGVCLATSGPGATNLITGLADAYIDSTPLVCITGQVFKHLLGTDAFQEADIIGITTPVTKWNYQITEAEEIPRIVAKAFYIAQNGRPGPVLLDITKNAQIEMMDWYYQPCHKVRSYQPKPPLDPQALDQAVALIKEAKRPMIFVGQGVLLSEAQDELRQFVEKTGIPVASTLLGLSAFPVDHPLYVGYLGMHGNFSTNLKTAESDLVIAIGMRFDDRVTGRVDGFLPQAKVIHIEIDPSEVNKIIPAEVALVNDAKMALQGLLEKVPASEHNSWIRSFDAFKLMEEQRVIQKDMAPSTPKIKMAEAVKMLSDMTVGEAIVVTDVGQHQMVASRYYGFRKWNSNITSGGLGTMGFALPAAIGAKIASPERPVVAIIGDAGYQMTMQELGMIMQYHIPVKIVVLNNSFLGMVRQWQELFFDRRYSSTEMENPDFVKMGEAFGIQSRRVEKREELTEAIQEMLQSPQAYFLEVVVEKENNVFPMVPSGEAVSNMRLE